MTESERHTKGPRPERAQIPGSWLPFHLILQWLPKRKLCQLRCVCKAWNALIVDDEPAQERLQEVWFVMARAICHESVEWEFIACPNYFTKTDSPFFRFPLPNCRHGKLSSFLGGSRCTRLAFAQEDTLLPTSWGWRLFFYPPLASAGGLICAAVRKPSGTLNDCQMILLNCLTGSVKLLPPLLRPAASACAGGTVSFYVFMALDNSLNYYIMLSSSMRYTLPSHFEIFNSRKGCWSLGRTFAEDSCELKVSDADFFFLEQGHSNNAWLRAYHVLLDAWSSVLTQVDMCEDAVYLPALTKYKDRVLLAFPLARVHTDRPRTCFGFVVLELQQATSSGLAMWVEVVRTPPHLWPALIKYNWVFEIAANEGLFYMTYINRQNKKSAPPLVFDIAHSSWYSLPHERCTGEFACVFVHRPKFSVLLGSVGQH